jgi:hypothetical protein
VVDDIPVRLQFRFPAAELVAAARRVGLAAFQQRAPVFELFDVLKSDDQRAPLAGPNEHDVRQRADVLSLRRATLSLAEIRAVGRRVQVDDLATGQHVVRVDFPHARVQVVRQRVVKRVNADGRAPVVDHEVDVAVAVAAIDERLLGPDRPAAHTGEQVDDSRRKKVGQTVGAQDVWCCSTDHAASLLVARSPRDSLNCATAT